MPMPPPRATESVPKRRRAREVRQILRALDDKGKADHEALKQLVGGDYWDPGRFDAAVAHAVETSQVIRDEDGNYTTS